MEGQPLPEKFWPAAGGFRAAEADYLAWSPVGTSGWNALIIAPAAAVEQPFARARTAVLVGGACSAVLTAFLVVFLSSAWAARRETAGLKSEIAERKRAEDDLTTALHRLTLAHEAANSGAWDWDLRTNANVWSDELWRLYGLEPHVCVPSSMPGCRRCTRTTAPGPSRPCARRPRPEASFTPNGVCTPAGQPERWLMSRGRALRDADGNVVRYIGIVVDITHRKTAEMALRASEEKFRHFAENANEGIWALDAGQRVTFVNPRLADMLGIRHRRHERPAGGRLPLRRGSGGPPLQNGRAPAGRTRHPMNGACGTGAEPPSSGPWFPPSRSWIRPAGSRVRSGCSRTSPRARPRTRRFARAKNVSVSLRHQPRLDQHQPPG